MKNDILRKNGQFRNVRVEYGFGAGWEHTSSEETVKYCKLSRM